MKYFTVKTLSDKELDDKHGNHPRYDVGKCFKSNDGHYFRQKEKNVLHVVLYDLINVVHNSVMDDKILGKNLTEITENEFLEKLKLTIFELGIYSYSTEKIGTI